MIYLTLEIQVKLLMLAINAPKIKARMSQKDLEFVESIIRQVKN